MGVIHMDDQLKTLQSWINESSYSVAVTGAGVSVTAGIPDMQHMNIVSTLQMMSETILKAAPGRYYKGVYKGFLKAVYAQCHKQRRNTVEYKIITHLSLFPLLLSL